MNLHLYLNPRPARRGVALVVILALIVLVTGLVVGFFSRAMSSRQVTNSSVSTMKADLLAMSAVDGITGDLKQEIVLASLVSTSGSRDIYYPSTANSGVLMRPARFVPMNSGILDNSTPIASDTMRNLIQISHRSAISATGLGAGTPLFISGSASAVSGTDTSLSGGRIGLARWNSHYLIPRKNPGSATLDSTPIANFTSPDWVFVSRGGPIVVDNSLLGNLSNSINQSNSGNMNYVIGRYAYAIYDEGGLLDVNVAGYPSTANPAHKGAAALADLTLLPITSGALKSQDIDNIVGWRNYATAGLGGSAFGSFTFTTGQGSSWLKNFVLNNDSGFLKVSGSSGGLSDQAFLSRQQLIQFLTAIASSPNSSGIASLLNALQYLGTFSREVNAPSWAPTANASDMGGSSSSTYAYKDNKDNAAEPNRFIPNVRIPSNAVITSYKSNGAAFQYAINANEPLVQRRFPLKRLNWLTQTGPGNGGTAASVQACFGLTWDSSPSSFRWIYTGSAGSTPVTAIKTLAQVAADQREPNFFEMLKAGILKGSLGLVTYSQTQRGGVYGAVTGFGQNDSPPYNLANKSYNNGAAPYTMEDAQIIQIGLNIIDQWDSDSLPTRVLFGGVTGSGPYEFYGSEDLPYIYRFAQTAYRPINGVSGGLSGGGANQLMGDAWLEPVLWNPYNSANGANANRPSTVRIRMFGGWMQLDFIVVPNSPVWCSPVLTPNNGSSPTLSISRGTLASDLSLSTSSQPVLLRDLWRSGATVLGDNANDIFTADGNPGYVGFWLGEFPLAISGPSPDVKVSMLGTNGGGDQGPRFALEVDYGGGVFKEVQRMAFGSNGYLWNYLISNDQSVRAQERRIFYAGMNDPRTGRFGIAMQKITSDQSWWNKTSFWDSNTQNDTLWNFSTTDGAPVAPSQLDGIPALHTYRYADNSSTVPSEFYADRDGVQRLGDAYFAGSAANQNSLSMLSDLTYRPILLNRPFYSVAEMGYAFRDLPWKTLNFCSGVAGANAYSADAALLDLFCVNDPDDNGLVAGKINLNTRNAAVIGAVLANGLRAETDVGNTITPAEALASGTNLAALTTGPTGALANLSELVTRFGGDPSLVTSKYDPKNYKYLKSWKEAVLRSLVDSGQTRTWNLMIDVIAQTGHYPPTAKKIQGFYVEGEKRYWVHLAIDRFTGKVVDRKIEPVQE